MSLTVGEVLENANYNLRNVKIDIQIEIAKSQLENYNIAKQLGADDEDDWAEWEISVENYKKQNKN
jgi:hypothetical protein